MQIIPILYGRSTLPESMAFENGEKGKSVPIDFKIFYLQTAEKRILIDAGCDTMPNFEMIDFIGPVKALEKNNIDKDKITDVIITHAHHDHIQGVKHFPNATIHIQKDEYELGRKHIPENFSVNIFEEEFSLCDGVEIIKIGGHSPGSCIVEIKEDNKAVVVASDECYVRENLTKKIPTGVTFSREKSHAFIEKYSSEEYTVLLSHERTF